MSLPRNEREISLLTEDWPADQENLELSAFAARMRADRPELSAPALERIDGTIQAELARQHRSAERRAAFLAMIVRARRIAPMSAAAMLALAFGLWLHTRHSPAIPEKPAQGVPVIHSQTEPSAEGDHTTVRDRPVAN